MPFHEKPPLGKVYGIRDTLQVPPHVKCGIGGERGKEVIPGRFQLNRSVGKLDEGEFLRVNDKGTYRPPVRINARSVKSGSGWIAWPDACARANGSLFSPSQAAHPPAIFNKNLRDIFSDPFSDIRYPFIV